MRVVLYLLNKKGFSCLNFLIKNKYSHLIEAVILSHDFGNKEDYFSEMENLCISNNIKVFNRLDIVKTSFSSDMQIAIGWKWLIKDPTNLIVFHDSILPKYRGFAPLPNMLINGENEIGVTALLANNNMDEGDIVFQEIQQIQYPIKIYDAIEIVAILYVRIIQKLFNSLLGNIPFILLPQDNREATYSLWRDNDDYYIDWNNEASYIKRFVDAVGYPYEGAQSKIDDKTIHIIEVEEINDLTFETPHYGKILNIVNGEPIIVCKSGAIRIKKALFKNEVYIFNHVRKKLK